MGNIPAIPVQQVNGPVPMSWQPAPAASGGVANTPAWNTPANNTGVLGQMGNSLANVPQNLYSGVSGLGQGVSGLFPFFQAEAMSEEDYRNWKDDATMDDYMPFRKYWEWRQCSDCQVDNWDRYSSFSSWWKKEKRHPEKYRRDYQSWKKCWHPLEVGLWREARAWRRLKEQLKRRHAGKHSDDSYTYDASTYKGSNGKYNDDGLSQYQGMYNGYDQSMYKGSNGKYNGKNGYGSNGYDQSMYNDKYDDNSYVSDSSRVAPNSKMQRQYEQFHRDSDLQSYQQYYYAQKWRQHAGDNWRNEDKYWRWYRDNRMGRRQLQDRYRNWRRNYNDKNDYDFWHWYDYNGNKRHMNWIVYEDNYAD